MYYTNTHIQITSHFPFWYRFSRNGYEECIIISASCIILLLLLLLMFFFRFIWSFCRTAIILLSTHKDFNILKVNWELKMKWESKLLWCICCVWNGYRYIYKLPLSPPLFYSFYFLPFFLAFFPVLPSSWRRKLIFHFCFVLFFCTNSGCFSMEMKINIRNHLLIYFSCTFALTAHNYKLPLLTFINLFYLL